MYLAETKGIHEVSDSSGTLKILPEGRIVFCKTSRDANRSGDIRGRANRGYLASQKRCHRRNHYLRPTARHSFAAFLFCLFCFV